MCQDAFDELRALEKEFAEMCEAAKTGEPLNMDSLVDHKSRYNAACEKIYVNMWEKFAVNQGVKFQNA